MKERGIFRVANFRFDGLMARAPFGFHWRRKSERRNNGARHAANGAHRSVGILGFGSRYQDQLSFSVK
jgi:hypothetical protein